jgi:hypothetical protein
MKRALLLLAVCPVFAYANIDKLVEDSAIKTTFRMDYIDLHSDGFGSDVYGFSDYDMGTWANSVKVAYQSGYLNDTFGIDVDVFALDPIGEQGAGFSTREVVKQDENGDPVGFVSLPQVYLKQKFLIGETSVELFEGRRSLKEYGGTSVEDNASKSSYTSLSSEIKNDAWLVKLGYMTQYSDSDEDLAYDLDNAEGDKINYIATVDGTYKLDSNEYRYYYTESDGYMRKQQVRVNHGFAPGWLGAPGKLSATITYENALAHYKSMSASNRAMDNDAAMYELDGEFYFEKGFVKLAYNYTSAPKEAGLGKFDLNMAKNVQGSQDTITSGNAWDYNNDKEHQIAFIAFRDLSESFSMGIDARMGMFDYEGDTINEGEVSFVNLWHPTDIPRLSVSFVAARDRSFKRSFDNTPYLVDGEFQRSNGHAFVSTIQYSF